MHLPCQVFEAFVTYNISVTSGDNLTMTEDLF